MPPAAGGEDTVASRQGSRPIGNSTLGPKSVSVLVAVGDGMAGGGVTAAWVGVGDGAATVGEGDGDGADVDGPLAATCGFEPGAISSLVK